VSPSRWPSNDTRHVVRLVSTAALSLVGLYVLVTVSTRMGCPFFEPWALAHGAFIVPLPVLMLLAYLLLGPIPWFRGGDA
jgi:hypothetical protein